MVERNRHWGMDLRRVWFKQGEYEELKNAMEENNKEKVLDIIFAIKERKDL